MSTYEHSHLCVTKMLKKRKGLIEKQHLFFKKKMLENRSVSIPLPKNQFQMDERPHSM